MKRVLRQGVPVLAAGLALGAAAVLAPSASAATDAYRATLAVSLVTQNGTNSVLLRINGNYTCYTGFEGTAKSPKEISLTVQPGTLITLYSSVSCYNSLGWAQVTINSDGQRTNIAL